MANPRRMEIIDLLAQGPLSVEKIAGQTDMTIANTSQHLQALKNARLVNTSRQGNHIYYHLASEKVFIAWRALRELGFAQNAEAGKLLSDFYNSRHQLEPVSMEELRKRMAAEDVIVLDVRPDEEYQRGHIHKALSIPIDQLAERMKELSSDKEIIAYCRGPLCVFADEAVALLKGSGFKAKRLKEGFPDWKAEGFPVHSNLQKTTH